MLGSLERSKLELQCAYSVAFRSDVLCCEEAGKWILANIVIVPAGQDMHNSTVRCGDSLVDRCRSPSLSIIIIKINDYQKIISVRDDEEYGRMKGRTGACKMWNWNELQQSNERRCRFTREPTRSLTFAFNSTWVAFAHADRIYCLHNSTLIDAVVVVASPDHLRLRIRSSELNKE